MHERTSNFQDDTERTHLQSDTLGMASDAARRRANISWTDASGAHTAVVDATMTVGSGETVDLVVADPAVSRVHAEIELRTDGAWIRDLSSRNGSYVAGVRVQSARIPDRAIVRLGSVSLAVTYDAEPALVELWPHESFGPLIGRCAAMREFFSRLARFAPKDSTVLIQGETGSGKELVARALHDMSPRATQPFVVVDCGAMPENLLESELFGHAKGAFTGAVSARAGAIEEADGGTVFLDEIGELPLAMQPKLLRVLESHTVRRVGEATQRKLNVRFVSATHRDLAVMVNEGTFREDLYFRLAVLPATVPPLRARRDDIPLLVQHFMPPDTRGTVSPELLQELMGRPWLGNVRELRNFVERAMVLGAREALELSPATTTKPAASATSDALPSPSLDMSFKDLREQWLTHLEREYVRGLLLRHQRNITAVGRAAGLDPSYVHRLIKKHGL